MSATGQQFAFFDLRAPVDDITAEVQQGLRESPKKLSPKFFYDERGSKLFEAITRLQAYYPTRTELGLFDAYLQQIAALIGQDSCVVEYGSMTIRMPLPDRVAVAAVFMVVDTASGKN